MNRRTICLDKRVITIHIERDFLQSKLKDKDIFDISTTLLETVSTYTLISTEHIELLAWETIFA